MRSRRRLGDDPVSRKKGCRLAVNRRLPPPLECHDAEDVGTHLGIATAIAHLDGRAFDAVEFHAEILFDAASPLTASRNSGNRDLRPASNSKRFHSSSWAFRYWSAVSPG